MEQVSAQPGPRTAVQPAVPGMRPIFVGGCERSGTTLLGAMLGAHPACLCVPEMPFKLNILRQWDWDGSRPEARLVARWLARNWRFRIWGLDLAQEQWPADRPGYRQTVEFLVSAYGRRVGKPGPQVWVDHTPANVRSACTLFHHFPDARIVHIVRDGRAVANSIMPLEWGPNEVESAAHFWTESLAWGLAAEARWGPERVIRARYEDLVSDPEGTLEQLSPRLGLDYQPEMAAASGFRVPRYTVGQHALVGARPDPRRLDAWRRELSPRQVEIFESIAGELLCYLGYEPVFGQRARRPSLSERLASRLRDNARKAVNAYRQRRRISSALDGEGGQ